MDENKEILFKKILAISFVIIYFLFTLYIIFSSVSNTYLGTLYQKSCGEYATSEERTPYEFKIISNKDVMCPIINPLTIIGELLYEIWQLFPPVFIFVAIGYIILLYLIGSFLFKWILKIPSKIAIILLILFLLLLPIIIIVSLLTQNPCNGFQGNELSNCLEGAYDAHDDYYMQIVLVTSPSISTLPEDYSTKYITEARDIIRKINDACSKIVFDIRREHCYKDYRDSFINSINISL